jgi:hypothetical protein
MAGVQRNEFVQRLADRGGYVVVDQLPSEVQSALSQVGIQPQDLQRIAGSDGVIRGNTEFEALFREIDRRDGRLDQQLTTRGPSGELTAAGRIYEGLGQVVDANRARAAAEGGRRFTGEPSLEAVQNGQRLLELGASGEGVRRVQQALSDIGFDTPSGVTGTFDAETATPCSASSATPGCAWTAAWGARPWARWPPALRRRAASSTAAPSMTGSTPTAAST